MCHYISTLLQCSIIALRSSDLKRHWRAAERCRQRTTLEQTRCTPCRFCGAGSAFSVRHFRAACRLSVCRLVFSTSGSGGGVRRLRTGRSSNCDPGAVTSDRNDLDEVIESGEVSSVTGVQARLVSVGRRSDQEIEDARPWLAPGTDHGAGESSVARSDGVIDGK